MGGINFAPSAHGATGAILLALMACVVLGQPAERPKFEVASVKSTPEDARSYSGIRPIVGGRLLAQNCSVRQLITNAYRLKDFQVMEGAAWLRDQGFDVEAKGDSTATHERVMLMLQSLLEERFQLRYHRETRELPVLALIVGKNGSTLTVPKEGGCVKPDPTVSLPASGCGIISVGMSGGRLNARGGDVPMAELIRQLSLLGRPVLDKTGITTNFDVRLEFAADDSLEGMMKQWSTVEGHRESMTASAAAAEKDPRAAPNILLAVQEQLGLKLEATRGPVEVMVIDHVERPSAN